MEMETTRTWRGSAMDGAGLGFTGMSRATNILSFVSRGRMLRPMPHGSRPKPVRHIDYSLRRNGSMRPVEVRPHCILGALHYGTLVPFPTVPTDVQGSLVGGSLSGQKRPVTMGRSTLRASAHSRGMGSACS